MTKDELLFWCDKYNKEEDKKWLKTEEILGKKIRTNEELSKEDFIELLNWKFNSFPARLKRELNLVRDLDDMCIRSTIKRALNTEEEKQKIRILFEIRGVGNAVASVILTFYNPQNYGIFDIHVWRELFGEGVKMNSSRILDYLKLLDGLRAIAKQHRLKVRCIEKAFFKKNKDKNKK